VRSFGKKQVTPKNASRAVHEEIESTMMFAWTALRETLSL